MAAVNNFWGAETGGLEEASATGGSPSASTTSSPPGGHYYYYMNNGDSVTLDPFVSIADTGAPYIFGFRFRVLTIPTGGNTGRLIQVRNAVGLRVVAVELTATGIRVQDNGGNNHEFTTTININQWYYVEVYFESAASGALQAWIENVLFVNETAVDTDAGAIEDLHMTGDTDLTDLLVDDIYFMSAASPEDRLGPCRVLSHQIDSTFGAAPDSGDTLNTGTWGDTGDTPISVGEAIYSNAAQQDGYVFLDQSNAGGQGRGIVNQELDDARAPPLSFVNRMKIIGSCSRGTGSATSHYMLYGTDAADTGTSGTYDIILTGTKAIFEHVLTQAMRDLLVNPDVFEPLSAIPRDTTFDVSPDGIVYCLKNETQPIETIGISHDGGISWVEVALNSWNAAIDICNSIAAGDNGEVVVAAIDSTTAGEEIHVTYSGDYGKTWSTPASAGFPSNVTSDGHVYWGNGIFVIFGSISAGDGYIRWSDDGGATWTASTGLPTSIEFLRNIATDGAGTWCALYSDTSTNVRVYRSTNDATSFSVATTNPITTNGGDAIAGIGYCKAADAWAIGQGRVDTGGAAPGPYFSTDGGATWTESTSAAAITASYGGAQGVVLEGHVTHFTLGTNVWFSLDGDTWTRIQEIDISDWTHLSNGKYSPKINAYINIEQGDYNSVVRDLVVVGGAATSASRLILGMGKGAGGRDLECDGLWLMSLQRQLRIQEGDPGEGKPWTRRTQMQTRLRR
jgi:hypothetical protein